MRRFRVNMNQKVELLGTKIIPMDCYRNKRKVHGVCVLHDKT